MGAPEIKPPQGFQLDSDPASPPPGFTEDVPKPPDGFVPTEILDRARDRTYDPAAHAVQSPDESEAAFQAWKQRDERTLGEKAKAFGGEFLHPENYGNALKGVAKFGAGLVATPVLSAGGALANEAGRIGEGIRSLVLTPEQEAARETAEANAHGEDMSLPAKLSGLATTAKAQSVLAGQDIENTIGSHLRKIGTSYADMFQNFLSPDQKETYQRWKFGKEVADRRAQMQIAQGIPQKTGPIAWTMGNVLGEAPAAFTPERLAEIGAPAISPLAVELESSAANPENLALAKAGNIPGVKQVGGALTEGVGKVAELPGKAVSAIAPAAHYIPFVGRIARMGVEQGAKALGSGLQWLGRGLEEQGGAARTGLPSALDTASGIARVNGKSSLLTDAQRAIGTGAATGASTALGMAPLNALQSGGNPEEMSKSTIGAGVFGAALGGTHSAFDRAAITEAVKPYLAARGEQSYDTNSAEGRASMNVINGLSAEQRQNALALVGALGNLPTESGAPARMIVMNGPEYQRMISSLPGATAAEGGRGFVWTPDGTAYINAGSESFSNPTEAAHTMGHEFGGHVALSILRAASAQGGPLYKALMDEARSGLMLPSGQPTGAFRKFIDQYNLAFDPTGQHRQLEASDPHALEEWIAEQAGQQLSHKGVGDIAVPDNIRDRIAQGVGRFASLFTGIDPRKVGGDTKFSREEIGGLSEAVRDSLQQLAGMKLRGEGVDPRLANANEFLGANEPREQTTAQRIEQLQEILSTPRPDSDASAEDARDWVKQQAAARTELRNLQGGEAKSTPDWFRETVPQATSTSSSVPDSVGVKLPATEGVSVPASDSVITKPTIPTSVKVNVPQEPEPAKPALNRFQVAAALRLNGVPATEAKMWSEQAEGETVGDAVIDALKRRAQAKFGKPEAPKASGEKPATPPLPTSTPEQPVGAASSPPNEISTSQEKDESLRTGGIAVESGAPTERATDQPAPVPQEPKLGDFDEIAARAREGFLADKAPAKAGKNKGQHTKENQRAADTAAFYAAAQAHAETVPPNYQGIRLRTDAFGKKSVNGTVDPSRPFDAWLLKQAADAGNMKGDASQVLQQLQDRIGKLTEYDYGHAPTAPEGEQPTGEARGAQQEEHTASARAAGEAPQQVEQKTGIPLSVRFNNGTKSFTVTGASPEKLLNNFNHVAEAISQVPGEKMPYRDINDPRFVADFKGAVRNQQNGWRADGSAPRVGTTEYPSNPTEGFENSPERYRMPSERADFINVLLAEEGLKGAVSAKPSPEAKAKAVLANANDQPYTAEGESNPLRQRINDALAATHGPFLDRNGKPSTWSRVTLEDPIDEAIRPDLASRIREPSGADVSIRQHGKLGDLSRFFSEGVPNRAAAAANFLPEDTGKPGESEHPMENLAREAEQAGVPMSAATLIGLTRHDPETMASVRRRIEQKTGKPAQFQPEGGSDLLYRAGDAKERGVKAFSSWSEDRKTAEAYLDNPGFGGKSLRRESYPLSNTLSLDTTNRKGMADLAEALGFSRDKGDEWFDNGWRYPWEESKKVSDAMENSGFDAIRYPDDFPEGAITVVPLKNKRGYQPVGQSNLTAPVQKNIAEAKMMNPGDPGAFLRQMADASRRQGKEDAARNFEAAIAALKSGQFMPSRSSTSRSVRSPYSAAAQARVDERRKRQPASVR